MPAEEHERRRRAAQRPRTGDTGAILPFPSAKTCPGRGGDLLVDRLRHDKAAVAGRCLSEWADPFDAAILAALLLDDPRRELEQRAREACVTGRSGEAAFWRESFTLLVAITSEDGEAGLV